jgi:hypothetical protein
MQGGQALDEAVQDRLALRVDPVQVLEHDQDGLELALSQEEAPDGLERPLPALGWLQGLPPGVFDWDVEEGEEGRLCRLECRVQRENLPRHLLADVAVHIAVGDPKIALEEVDHRQIAAGLAVGRRGGLQDQAVCHPVRVAQLEDEPPLANAGLADDRRHLTATLPGLLERASELLDLGKGVPAAWRTPGRTSRRGGCRAGTGDTASWSPLHPSQDG